MLQKLQMLLLLILVALPSFYCASESRHGSHTGSQASDETRLLSKLLHNYHTQNPHRIRPLKNSSQTMNVQFGVSLIQIVQFNEKDQYLTTLLWKTYMWKDEYLNWDPNDYGGRTNVVLNPDQIWVPDVLLYNTIMKPSKDQDQAYSLYVTNKGEAVWIPQVRYESACTLDMVHFPFDTQDCSLNFGLWTEDSKDIQLHFFDDQKELDLAVYTPCSEWHLTASTAERVLQNYSCCPGRQYSHIVYKLRLERRVTFHIKLILTPTILLSVMSCAVFWVPTNKPDRTTLSVGLFSSVFLLLITLLDNSPPTSGTRLGTFYIILILLVALGVIFTVLIFNISAMDSKVPPIIDKIIRIFNCEPCHKEPNKIEKEEYEEFSDNHKWQQFALIINRLLFVIFVILVILSYAFVFPTPFR